MIKASVNLKQFCERNGSIEASRAYHQYVVNEAVDFEGFVIHFVPPDFSEKRPLWAMVAYDVISDFLRYCDLHGVTEVDAE